jgi:hypothetical protein
LRIKEQETHLNLLVHDDDDDDDDDDDKSDKSPDTAGNRTTIPRTFWSWPVHYADMHKRQKQLVLIFIIAILHFYEVLLIHQQMHH